jgi:indole-3-acetate monooxygenase
MCGDTSAWGVTTTTITSTTSGEFPVCCGTEQGDTSAMATSTTEDMQSPTVNDLLAVVAGAVEEIERSRRLPESVVTALRDSGIHRLAIPRELGGLEASVPDAMDVFERIAAVDGSTAWCAVIGAGSNLFAGYLPEETARLIFADPDQGNATMFAPTGRIVLNGDQHVLNGRWSFTSNCLHSEWAGLGAFVDGLDATPRVAFVPVRTLEVEDTWYSAGLCGTGSHHVSAKDVPVTLDRCCTFADHPWPAGTMWRLPIYTILLPTLTAVPLGIARGALDEIGRQAREGRTARRGQLADDPTSMAEFAATDARLRAARAALHEAVNEARERAEGAQAVDRVRQARVLVACLHACDTAVAATSVAHQLGGGAAAYTGSRLLRALCDVQAARQHLLFSPKHLPELAKPLAGLDTTYPPFII